MTPNDNKTMEQSDGHRDRWSADPFGEDRLAAAIVGACVALTVVGTLLTYGFSAEAYRWADGALPLWLDLTLTALVVPIVVCGFFVVIAAVLRGVDRRQA